MTKVAGKLTRGNKSPESCCFAFVLIIQSAAGHRCIGIRYNLPGQCPQHAFDRTTWRGKNHAPKTHPHDSSAHELRRKSRDHAHAGRRSHRSHPGTATQTASEFGVCPRNSLNSQFKLTESLATAAWKLLWNVDVPRTPHENLGENTAGTYFVRFPRTFTCDQKQQFQHKVDRMSTLFCGECPSQLHR
jgi:hypothetical protein